MLKVLLSCAMLREAKLIVNKKDLDFSYFKIVFQMIITKHLYYGVLLNYTSSI